jgi:putative acetyltransferase
MSTRLNTEEPEVTIRVMRSDEFETMRELSVSAFDDNPQIRDLVDDLHESWAWDDELSFVAELDGQLVGQVLYTHAFLDTRERPVDVLVLSPVSVRPDQQGKGIGSKLIRQSLARISQRAESAVFLEGHPGYYTRFGFHRASDLGFTPPSVRVSNDAFMVRRLPRYQSWMTGALVYPDPFWRADAVGLRDHSATSTG